MNHVVAVNLVIVESLVIACLIAITIVIFFGII